jgi:hypothetical protein
MLVTAESCHPRDALLSNGSGPDRSIFFLPHTVEDSMRSARLHSDVLQPKRAYPFVGANEPWCNEIASPGIPFSTSK